jgi:hypothetical protein
MICNRKVKRTSKRRPLVTELLLTSDGRILVHNLTSSFAEILSQLDPEDQSLVSRSIHSDTSSP